MSCCTRDLKIGRLLFRTYRTAGRGFHVRVLRRWSYVEIWVFGRMFYAAIMHKDSCTCDNCEIERAFYEDCEEWA
jgi:hypothetical protein